MPKSSQNLLIFASWFPNHVQPSNGNFAEKHIRLTAQRYPLTVFQVEYDPSLPFWKQEWVESKQDDYQLLSIYFGNQTGRFSRFFQRLFLCWRAFVYLKRKKAFDLLHVHVAMPGVFLGYLINKLYRIPFILSCHSSGFLPNKAKTYPYWQRRLLMICANKAVVVCPVSMALADALKENGLSVPMQLISNVVNTALFYPAKILPAIVPLKLLHISNFHPQAKNVEGLLRVAQQLSLKKMPFQLTIAGDGDLERIQSYAQQLGLPKDVVRFYGTLNEQEVANMMREHHVYVLFSNYETQGVTLLEAQCCGLSIIATRVGGIPEIISEKWMGNLVEAGDEEALAAQIENQLNHYSSAHRQKISDFAMTRYSEEAVKRLFKELYNQL